MGGGGPGPPGSSHPSMNFQQAVAPPRSKSSSYLSQYGTLSHTPNNKLSRKNGCRDRSVDSLVVKASQGESGTASAVTVSNTSASINRNNLKSLSEEIIDNGGHLMSEEMEANAENVENTTPVNSRAVSSSAETPDVSQQGCMY